MRILVGALCRIGRTTGIAGYFLDCRRHFSNGSRNLISRVVGLVGIARNS